MNVFIGLGMILLAILACIALVALGAVVLWFLLKAVAWLIVILAAIVGVLLVVLLLAGVGVGVIGLGVVFFEHIRKRSVFTRLSTVQAYFTQIKLQGREVYLRWTGKGE